ncbi:MAG: hypothetical protein KJO85_07370, partial [Gammaproteobacteria bacterium]|nr:hypothetical protein [Gammaproteobacteria bacterium]
MFIKTNLKPLFKILVVPVCAAALVSCAVAPSGDGSGAPTQATPSSSANEGDIRVGFDAYQKRDFTDAYNAYERATGSADSRTARLAHLGKALVYLSTDGQWRDVNKAALSLQAAESVEGNPSIESSMLINSLSSLIGVEADITALNRQVSNSSVELGRLKQER